MLITIQTIVELSTRVIELSRISELQQAVFPLFPVLISAIIGLIATTTIIIDGDKPTDKFNNQKSVNIAILGPNEAGKTTLWNFLKGKPQSNTYTETDGKVHLSFFASNIVWKIIPPNTKIEGCDINGNGDFIRTDWKKMINDSNVVIFVFNAYKYLNDIDYQRDINQRLQFVLTTIDEQKIGKKRDVWLLGSYADKFDDRKKEWRKVLEIIKTKPYCEISNNNACVNLTKNDELQKYFNELFTRYE